MTSRQPKPFQLHVADELLGQTRTKLENARFPDGLQNSGWNEGTPTSEIRKLRDFWLSSYDWKTEEEKINSEMPQFKMEVPVVGWGDIELHFAHIRSERSDAIPLLFIHGCKYAKMKSKLLKHFPGPGHFLEARKLVPLLTGPQDPKTPAFHVIVPSIPGFGFSYNPERRGFEYPQIAESFNNLMLALGYDSYVAQGGDVGSFLSCQLGQTYPDRCRAVLVNMLVAPPPQFAKSPLAWIKWNTAPQLFYSKLEMDNLARTAWFSRGETGYQAIQGTKPQSLSYGLWDSPIALMAWIREKLDAWSDAYPWNENEVITWVMIYWISQVTGGLRIYKTGNVSKVVTGYVHVPFGVSVFPKEIFAAPKDWARASGNLKFYRAHKSGGHFAAVERPEVLVQDIRDFFGTNGPVNPGYML